MSVPHAVVESELDFLLHVTRKILGSDPARVDVERRFAAVRIFIDQPQLRRIPRIPISGSDDAALSRARHSLEPPAEGEVYDLDVVNRDIRARVAAADPFRKLSFRNAP